MSGSENSLPPTPLSQAQWDPSTIANIIFGVIMISVGMVAVWQGRHRRVIAIDEEQVVFISQAPTLMASTLTTLQDDSVGNLRQEPQPLTCHHLPKPRTTSLPPIENTEANEASTLSHGPTAEDMVFLSNRLTTFSSVESVGADATQTSHVIEFKEATKGARLHDGVEHVNV